MATRTPIGGQLSNVNGLANLRAITAPERMQEASVWSPPSSTGWRNDGSLHLDDIGLASGLFNLKSGAGGFKDWQDEHGTNVEGGMLNERGRQVLEQAKRYDPNATINYNGELEFDDTKLPKWAGGDVANFKKYGGVASLSENNAGDRLMNPDMVIHDKNYGDYTLRGNLKTAEGDKDSGFMGQLGKYMPMVVSAIMAGGMGAAVGPLLGGLMSGTLGPGGLANQWTNGGAGDWKGLGTRFGMGLLNQYLPGASTAYSLYNLNKQLKG